MKTLMRWIAYCLLLCSSWMPRFALGAEPNEIVSSASSMTQVGTLQSTLLRESSGLAPCRTAPNLYWTHNDGKHHTLFLIDREGRDHGNTQISAGFVDWEDIASDYQGHLYLGDLGNNEGRRQELSVYEIDEPDAANLAPLVRVKRSWRLRFPKEPFDCESLVIWQGYGYVVSKVFDNLKAGLYRFPLTNSAEPLTLERVAKLKIDSPVTGASISQDGSLLAIVSKSGAGVFRIDGNLKSAGITKPGWIRFRHEHIEACCFVPQGLLTTAESRQIFLIEDAELLPTHPPSAVPPPKN